MLAYVNSVKLGDSEAITNCIWALAVDVWRGNRKRKGSGVFTNLSRVVCNRQIWQRFGFVAFDSINNWWHSFTCKRFCKSISYLERSYVVYSLSNDCRSRIPDDRWPNQDHFSSWRRGVVASVVLRMNEVTLRRARLVLGWVTVFGRVYYHVM